MKKKLLLVTFPIDFGNTTWGSLLVKSFAKYVDLKIYRFAPGPDRKLKSKELMKLRFSSAYQLWQQIYAAQKERRKILFQGISPALFG